MAECQEFCLRWNNFQSNITHQFETLRDDEDFVDVTLTCGGKCIKAHKVVLSACSPYFKELLKNNPCKHPIIFMRDVEFTHLKALVAFMYAGVVNVAQAQLASFLRTAEALHILGLTEGPQLHRDLKNFPCESNSKSSSSQGPAAAASSPTGNATAASPGSKEEGEEKRNSSPSLAKRAKVSSEQRDEDGMGWSGSGCGDGDGDADGDGEVDGDGGDANDAHPPGSTVPASALFQQSRGGLVITPAEPTDNDMDQSYNDDLVDMLEPKTELPDYSSDGESRTDAASYLDNSSDVHGFGTMNDLMSATSSQGPAGQDGQPMESYQDWDHVDIQELTGGIGASFPRWRQRPAVQSRRRSTVSGHSVLHENMVSLGPGVQVPAAQLEALKWTDYRKLTRGLAGLVFTPLELATRSVTGQRWSRAASYGHGAASRLVKPALDSDKVNAILAHVRSAFPSVEPSRIKQVLAYKCQESSVALKMKAGIFGAGAPGSIQLLEQVSQASRRLHEQDQLAHRQTVKRNSSAVAVAAVTSAAAASTPCNDDQQDMVARS